MIGIDTNVIVRYMAQDDVTQSARATRLIEGECSPDSPGFIPLVVLVETVWVSESLYHATRAEVAQILRRLFSIRQLVVENSEAAWKALRTFEAARCDFADCLIHQIAIAEGCERVMTFDRQASKSGMSLLR